MVTIPLEEYDGLRAIAKADRWIPVTERLPKEAGAHRCWVDDPLGPHEAVQFYCSIGLWDRDPAFGPVTHWHPMGPGPGKGGMRDEGTIDYR